jgi:hypothetical protein
LPKMGAVVLLWHRLMGLRVAQERAFRSKHLVKSKSV